MTEKGQLGAALEFAMRVHAGQRDLAGEPYILHPVRVLLQFAESEVEARIVAVLHDVLEDGDGLTGEDLANRGFSQTVVTAMEAISRRPKERYAAYIERVAKNELALRVKIADLKDNLDVRRASTGKLAPSTVARYEKALYRLEHPGVEVRTVRRAEG